jgi:hypothetical protein
MTKEELEKAMNNTLSAAELKTIQRRLREQKDSVITYFDNPELTDKPIILENN